MPIFRHLLTIACAAAAAIAQERWELLPKAPLPPRHGATFHPVGTDLVVFGGTEVPGVHTAIRLDGAVFDTRTARWSALPDAPLGERKSPLVVPVGNGLYVTGGDDRWEKLRSEGAMLDVGKRQWLPVPKWPVAARWQPGIAVDGHLVGLFGGYVASTTRRGDGMITGHEFFADGVLVDTVTCTVTAIRKGPLSARTAPSVYLHAGKLLVIGGHTLSERSSVQPLHDAAFYDLASRAWTKLDAAPLRGNSDLQFVTLAGQVFVAGRERSHGRKAIAAIWDPATSAFAAVPGTDTLDFRVEVTRLFAGSARALVWNSGMNLADDMHQALWFSPTGWTPLPLPESVRARQAAGLVHAGNDVVLFGGNHDIGMAMVDGPPAPPAPKHFTGAEGDGLHVDLATGEVAPIPPGPLAPRGRPFCAIVGDRLYVLWGTVVHDLLADGASYRLR